MKMRDFLKNTKAQVTIFIIIAVIIVAAVLLVFALSPKLRENIGLGGEENPEEYIQTCVEEKLNNDIEKISLQGGSLNPEHYYNYEGEKLQYLCYSDEYYEKCAVEVPFLKEDIKDQIKQDISGKIDSCFNSLKNNYEDNNYQVQMNKGDFNVDILPKRVLVRINTSFSATKDEKTFSYEKFNVFANNNIYELAGIAENIVEWEVYYGEANVDRFNYLYSDIKVEKHSQSDETYIYIITNKKTGDKLQFASRSMAFAPVGEELSGVINE